MKFWMAPQGLHVEPAGPEDAQALTKLHDKAFYRGWPLQDFVSYLMSAETPAYIACDAKRRIAGFAMLRLVADECELLTIVVDPKWRGKKVGLALLRAAFDDLLMSPAKAMFLEVDEGNAPAIKLYKGLGFLPVGTRKGYYPKADGQPATAIVMRRNLG